jgi:hypothetical protein
MYSSWRNTAIQAEEYAVPVHFPVSPVYHPYFPMICRTRIGIVTNVAIVHRIIECRQRPTCQVVRHLTSSPNPIRILKPPSQSVPQSGESCAFLYRQGSLPCFRPPPLKRGLTPPSSSHSQRWMRITTPLADQFPKSGLCTATVS